MLLGRAVVDGRGVDDVSQVEDRVTEGHVVENHRRRGRHDGGSVGAAAAHEARAVDGVVGDQDEERAKQRDGGRADGQAVDHVERVGCGGERGCFRVGASRYRRRV